MKKNVLFSLLLVCLFLSALSVSQACFVDDDFEGAAAFVNQHYPVGDDNVTNPSVTPQGIFLRSWGNDANNKEEIANEFTGTQTTTRFFRGAKSYKLASGQFIKFGKRASGLVQGANVPMNFQFAVSTDAASAQLPVGTRIGHFKLDWSLSDTSLVEDSSYISFVIGANGKLQVKSEDNNAIIKEINCGPGHWTLISVAETVNITMDTLNSGPGNIWVLYDPLTQKHKGLQPKNPTVPPASPVATADFNYYSAGLQVFADANTTATTIRPLDINPKWGLVAAGAAGKADNEYNTYLQGWQIAAENNANIYIDDISWNIGLLNDPNRKIDQEQAARMLDFTTPTTEPAGPVEPPPASAKHWDLY